MEDHVLDYFLAGRSDFLENVRLPGNQQRLQEVTEPCQEVVWRNTDVPFSFFYSYLLYLVCLMYKNLTC